MVGPRAPDNDDETVDASDSDHRAASGRGLGLGRWQQTFLSSRAGTIFSGTSQIQRNTMGERALGLPKEPAAPGQLRDQPADE